MKIFALIALFTTWMACAAPSHAAPLAPADVARPGEHPSGITLVGGKNGSLARGSAQLRSFRTGLVTRVRPLHHVRPERPLEFNHQKRHAYARKRPSRPQIVQMPEDVLPDMPAAVRPERTVDEAWSAPDFCRYWGDRGDASGYHDHCW